MAALQGEQLELFKEVTNKTHKEQAIFFLNAYWKEHEGEAEKLWGQVNLMNELDEKNKDKGCGLDEMKAHIFLEKQGYTMTVIQLRNKLRDIDVDGNKSMSMVEFLLFSYEKKPAELLERPQGTNKKLQEATKDLEKVNEQIAAREAEKVELKEKADKAEGAVKKMRLMNELEQLNNRDNTEMNRTLMSAEAKVRQAKKEGGDPAMGAIWWIERELEEVRRYLPQKKQ